MRRLWLAASAALITHCGFPEYDWCAPDPSMVRVGDYCIDATEVTKAQYKSFLDSKGSDASGQLPQCIWNTSYVPSNTTDPPWPADPKYADYPMVNVDWCDAYAYCKWRGKRLCGAIRGGPITAGAGADAAQSQWTYACRNGGANTFPYGNAFDPQSCNGQDFAAPSGAKIVLAGDGGGALPVRFASKCHGRGAPFDRVFDMSGNVMEWEDNCSADECAIRGGGYLARTSSDLECADARYVPRNGPSPLRGMRCCWP